MKVIIHQIGPRDGEVLVLRGIVKNHYMIDGIPYTIEEYATESPDRETNFALVHPDLKKRMLGA